MIKEEKTKDILLIVPGPLKYQTIKKIREKGLSPIKVITLDELKRKYYFDYDEQAIHYLMKTDHISYDVAKMYLSHLYEVEGQTDSHFKIQNIIQIKQHLEQNNLLFYNPLLKEFLKNKTIVAYNCQFINSFDEKFLKEIEKITKVTYYNEEKQEYQHQIIYEFLNPTEEIHFVAEQICQLVNQGISLSKIKLCGVSESYLSTIKRIFDLHHIPIVFQDNFLFSTIMGQDFLNHLQEDPIESLKYLEKNYPIKEKEYRDIYDTILKIINKYIWSDSLLEVKELIQEDFKKTPLKIIHYQEEITIIHSLEESLEDDYIFLIGFNQGEIPKYQKDESYFNDTLKQKLGLKSTDIENQKETEKWLYHIRTTKNLIITTKKTNATGQCYLSSLNDDLNLSIQKGEINYNYSNLFNQLQLAEKIDTLIKYNEKDKDLEILFAHYPNIPYGTYHSNYKPISPTKIKKYLNNQLILSYSTMNSYYQCAFRYYLSNILKINIYEETFYTILGNLFHYILSICFKQEIDFDYEYENYLNHCTYEFNDREQFFLQNLKKELKFIINTIQKQNQTNSLEKMYTEEKIIIEKQRDDVKVLFKGFIDKIFVNKENSIISIIDYKTGNPELNLNHIIYGLDLQLPVYIYLAKQKFPNASVAGFYLQKILNNEITKDYKHSYEELKEDKLKLQGYSNSDTTILEKFDSNYSESQVIKGMKTTSKGISSKRVLTDEQINQLEQITEQKIEEAITNIINANFEINPKRVGMDNLGCKYCQFKDVCFMNETNIVQRTEYKNMEFFETTEIKP